MTKSPAKPDSDGLQDLQGLQTHGPTYDQVAAAIDLIRPVIQDDGGDIELLGIADGGVVRVRLHGACIGCPSSTMTLQHGVERIVREKVPQVTAVQQVP